MITNLLICLCWKSLKILYFYFQCFNPIPSISFSGSNPCHLRNGDCSNFCFVVPVADGLSQVGRHCGCPYGQKLSWDQRTCEPDPEEVEVSTCRLGQYQCDNGRCVPLSYRCDRDNDCLDGSDEADCPHSEF